MRYSPADIMRLTGQKRETIRKWSETFAPFLSASATPEAGGHRFYDDRDLQVFLTIAEARKRHVSLNQIALDMQMGNILPITTPEIALTPQENVETLNIVISTLKSELDQERGENRLLREQLAGAQQRLEQLLIENALLKRGQGDSQ